MIVPFIPANCNTVTAISVGVGAWLREPLPGATAEFAPSRITATLIPRYLLPAELRPWKMYNKMPLEDAIIKHHLDAERLYCMRRYDEVLVYAQVQNVSPH